MIEIEFEEMTPVIEEKILGCLKQYYNIGKQYYGNIHRRMKLLDSTDKGDLWRAIGAKFPPYQLLPDTNFVSKTKNYILASIYTVSKSSDIVPTNEEDVAICEELSIALEHEWDKHKIGYYEFLAGERASLLNLGLTQVLWDAEDDDLSFKNVDPIHFMRDPFAEELQESGWCTTYNNYHESVFMSNPLYKEAFLKSKANGDIVASTETLPDYADKNTASESDKHYNLFIWWVRRADGKIDEFHTIDNEVLLHYKLDVQPSMFPFAELYCNLPGSSLVGVSEPAKIFANNLCYNMLDSIALTSIYKNQRPPKFVNASSGLNIKAFSKHGNEADRTFIVNGDASKAIHYHTYPDVPASFPSMLDKLSYNIQDVSGIDEKYTGRDTGSITTTGGTQEMLNRVTLIDTPKVMCYEDYICQLTKLVLKFLLEFAPSRKYLVRDSSHTQASEKWTTAEVDFPDIPSDILFEYAVQVSSELPKNKQRVQAWADHIMEKQMQYKQEGLEIELITPEEWLRAQDIPYKEQMQERMGVDRRLNALLQANNVVNEYAQMIDQGVDPNDAMLVAADGLEQMRQGKPTPYQEQMAGMNNPLDTAPAYDSNEDAGLPIE